MRNKSTGSRIKWLDLPGMRPDRQYQQVLPELRSEGSGYCAAGFRRTDISTETDCDPKADANSCTGANL